MCRKFSPPAVYRIQRYQFHLWFHLFLFILHPLQKAKHFSCQFVPFQPQPFQATVYLCEEVAVPFTECTAASSSVILSLSLTTYRKMRNYAVQTDSTTQSRRKKATIVCFVFKLELQISCSVLTSISLVMVHLD